MAHFILIHGMFHGGWCWDRIKTRLQAAGHTVEAPDLHGCGTDPTPPETVTLAMWTEAVANQVRSAKSQVVLVGHSRGGLVISQVAEEVPEKIAALVYLTALMLPDGTSPMSLNTLMDEDDGNAGEVALRPQVNSAGTALIAPAEAIEALYASCSAADREWAIPQVGQEPMAPLGTAMALTAERYGRVPRIFIEAEADSVLPIGVQRSMIAHSPPDEVLTLPADHMPIFTHVAELAEMLDRIGARYATEVA